MLDVTEQLQRYADALGDVVPAHPGAGRKQRRVPSFLVATAVIVVVALATWAAIATTGGDESRIATEPQGQVLALPDSGASAQQLADGTPVWVVRHDDGSVSVLDAVSTHRPFGAGNLVGWCESSRGFLDPMYGSMYDERGRKQAGPTPRGLDSYPVTSVDGDTVSVTRPASPQPSAADGGPETAKPTGPYCFDQDDHANSYISGTYEMHQLVSSPPKTPQEAMRQPDGALVVVDAPVVIIEGAEPFVCTSMVVQEPPRCEGVPAPQFFAHDQPWIVVRGRFIARPHEGALTDIAYISERTTEWPP